MWAQHLAFKLPAHRTLLDVFPGMAFVMKEANEEEGDAYKQ